MNWVKFKKEYFRGFYSYWTYCANWLIGLVREFFGTDAEYPLAVFAVYEGRLEDEFREKYDAQLVYGC